MLVVALPWPSEELLVWALTVVVVLPSVVVWLKLPLAGRGISWPLTLKLVRLELVFEPPACELEVFKESSETEDSSVLADGREAAALTDVLVWPTGAAWA